MMFAFKLEKNIDNIENKNNNNTKKKSKAYLFSCVSVICDKAKFLHTRCTNLFILPSSQEEESHVREA